MKDVFRGLVLCIINRYHFFSNSLMLLSSHVLDTTEHLSKLILQILFDRCTDPPLSGRLYDCKLENQVRLELCFEHAFPTRQGHREDSAVQKGRGNITSDSWRITPNPANSLGLSSEFSLKRSKVLLQYFPTRHTNTVLFQLYISRLKTKPFRGLSHTCFLCSWF